MLFTNSFPASFRRETQNIILKEEISLNNKASVIIEGERLTFPYRIYAFPKVLQQPNDISSTQLIDCLLTRHHDGFVRQEFLRKLLAHQPLAYYKIPYVLKLVEEYVIEIVEDILLKVHTIPSDLLIRFINENPTWLSLMRSRCISYWDCYYRKRFPVYNDYPGLIIVNRIESLFA